MAAVAEPEIESRPTSGSDDEFVHVVCTTCGDQGDFAISLCGLAMGWEELELERPSGPTCRECKPLAKEHAMCMYGHCRA